MFSVSELKQTKVYQEALQEGEQAGEQAGEPRLVLRLLSRRINEFLFLKAVRQPIAEYANSRLFSLVNPNNELYSVLQVLKRLRLEAIANG